MGGKFSGFPLLEKKICLAASVKSDVLSQLKEDVHKWP